MNNLETKQLKQIARWNIRSFYEQIFDDFYQPFCLLIGILFDSLFQKQQIWSDLAQIVQLINKPIYELFIEIETLGREWFDG